MSPPTALLYQMMGFTQDLFIKGEDLESVAIQLHAQFSQRIYCGRHPTSRKDFASNMLRHLDQQESIKANNRRNEGAVKRVQKEWCCRCLVMTVFWNGECDQENCQHRRCDKCRNLAKVSQARTEPCKTGAAEIRLFSMVLRTASDD